MKKSEMLNIAQIAVVLSPAITPENKLKVLRVLMEEEDLAIYVEKRKEKDEQESNEKENCNAETV